MKTKLLSIAVLSLKLLFGQTILEDDFENFTNGLPNTFTGAKTNLPIDSISQGNGGLYSDQLLSVTNASTTHKRLATQSFNLNENEIYNIQLWVRGNGSIRTGVYDNRSTGFGYFYNAYVTVNSSQFEMISQDVIIANTFTDVEFILSLKETQAGSSLEIDSISIVKSNQSLNTSTIYDIQYTMDVSGDSPVVGSTVKTGGTVSATKNNGYYLQSGTGPFTGIFIYDTDNTVAIGDSVELVGVVEEFYNATQISSISSFNLVATNVSIQPTLVDCNNINAEGYESVFSRVENVTVVNPDAGFGMFTVNDGTGNLLVDDQLYQHTAVIYDEYHIQGIIDYSFSEYKLLPRMQSDIQEVTSSGINESNIAFEVYPNPFSSTINIIGAQDIQNKSLVIYDTQGNVVFELAHLTSTIHLEHLAPGIYIIAIENSNYRIIKQ